MPDRQNGDMRQKR